MDRLGGGGGEGRSWLAVALALTVAASSAAAQQSQVEAHGSYVRTTQSHSSSWGAGAQLNTNWGSKQAPVQFSSSEGLDWTRCNSPASHRFQAQATQLRGPLPPSKIACGNVPCAMRR